MVEYAVDPERRSTLQGQPTPSATRRPVLALAALALVSLAGAGYLSARGAHLAAIDLVSIGSLGRDERDMDGVERDIQSELNKNSLLTQSFHGTFGGGADMPKADASGNCKCDCSAKPQLASQARQMMLEQVGANVFFGKCASCPCLEGNSIEAEVARLSQALGSVTQVEDDLNKKEAESIPVDVVFRVGAKGMPGTIGPKGFKGADGEAGATGVFASGIIQITKFQDK